VSERGRGRPAVVQGEKRTRSTLPLLALVTALGLLGPAPARADRPLAQAPAPAFRVRDLAGHELSLAALRARGPVLIDFWATWCEPCRAALTELEDWRLRYGPRGLGIVAVSVDGPRNLAKVRPFVARLHLGCPVVIDDDGRLQALYQVSQLPLAVLVDTAGRIVTTRVGYRRGETGLAQRIESLLPADSTASGSPR